MEHLLLVVPLLAVVRIVGLWLLLRNDWQSQPANWHPAGTAPGKLRRCYR
jgi:hypothetical protein